MLSTALALFLTCRTLTQTSGVNDVRELQEAREVQWQGPPRYYVPLVLECATIGWGPTAKTAITNRYYYCWLFGVTDELPFSRQHVDEVTAEQTFPVIADERLRNRGFWSRLLMRLTTLE